MFTQLNTKTTKQLVNVNLKLNPILFSFIDNNVFLSIKDETTSLLRYDIPLSKQISDIFYKHSISGRILPNDNLVQGVIPNNSNIFPNKSHKIIRPMLIKIGQFPNYHMTIKSSEDKFFDINNIDKNDTIEQFINFDKHPIKNLLFEFLRNFETNESWKIVEKTDTKNLFTIKMFNWKLNQFTTLTTINKNPSFDNISTDHSDIINIFKDNNSIFPNLFNFIFYFNDKTNTESEYYSYLLTNTKQETIDLNLNYLNWKHNLNLKNTWNVPNHIFESDGKLVTNNKLMNKIPNMFYLMEDKNGWMYLTNNHSEHNLNLNINKINFNDIIGVDPKVSYIFSANNVFIGPTVQNMKITIQNQDQPIFKSGDSFGFRDDENNIEWKFVASDFEECDCDGSDKICKMDGRIMEFKPNDVMWNNDSIKFYIKGKWAMFENQNIDVFRTYVNEFYELDIENYHDTIKGKLPDIILIDEYNVLPEEIKRLYKLSTTIPEEKTTLKIYKFKYVKRNNEVYTSFSLYDPSFKNYEKYLKTTGWRFKYNEPDLYFSVFNRHKTINDIVERVKYITNDIWKDVSPYVVQVNEDLKNEFLFVNKTIETQKYSIIFNLSKNSSYQSIYINDIMFDTVVFNSNFEGDIFAYNESEFAKNGKENDIIFTIPKDKIDLNINFDDYVVSSSYGLFQLYMYKMGLLSSHNYAHTNNWISNKFFNQEYGFILENDKNLNLDQIFPSKIIKFMKKYNPIFIQSTVW